MFFFFLHRKQSRKKKIQQISLTTPPTRDVNCFFFMGQKLIQKRKTKDNSPVPAAVHVLVLTKKVHRGFTECAVSFLYLHMLCCCSATRRVGKTPRMIFDKLRANCSNQILLIFSSRTCQATLDKWIFSTTPSLVVSTPQKITCGNQFRTTLSKSHHTKRERESFCPRSQCFKQGSSDRIASYRPIPLDLESKLLTKVPTNTIGKFSSKKQTPKRPLLHTFGTNPASTRSPEKKKRFLRVIFCSKRK